MTTKAAYKPYPWLALTLLSSLYGCAAAPPATCPPPAQPPQELVREVTPDTRVKLDRILKQGQTSGQPSTR